MLWRRNWQNASWSERLSKISAFAALLWDRVQPHCDDYGRMPGDAMTVKAKAVPLRPETISDVENALVELENVRGDNSHGGLITRYRCQRTNRPFLEIDQWDKFQPAGSGNHRKNSEFVKPSEITSQMQCNEIQCNQMPNGASEEKRREEKRETPLPPLPRGSKANAHGNHRTRKAIIATAIWEHMDALRALQTAHKDPVERRAAIGMLLANRDAARIYQRITAKGKFWQAVNEMDTAKRQAYLEKEIDRCIRAEQSENEQGERGDL